MSALPNQPPILERLGIETGAFMDHMKGKHQEHYPKLIGRLDKIRQTYQTIEQTFIKGLYQSRLLYSG